MEIIHLRFDKVPRTLGLAALVELAILTDRYDITALMTPWMEGWVEHLYPSIQMAGNEFQWLWISWEYGLLNEALVSLIIVRNLPFRVIEWPEFHIFYRLLNPQSEDSLATAHSTVPKLIDRSWQQKKKHLRENIQSAISSIHLSLDIWTSPNRLLLLGVCGHFVDHPNSVRLPRPSWSESPLVQGQPLYSAVVVGAA